MNKVETVAKSITHEACAIVALVLTQRGDVEVRWHGDLSKLAVRVSAGQVADAMRTAIESNAK